MTLSKAQKHIVKKLQDSSKLIAVSRTWFPENVFFHNPDGTYERSNVKVVRTLVGKNVLMEKQTGHLLVREYTLNVTTLAGITE